VAELTGGLIRISLQPLGLPLLIQLGEGDVRILLLEQDPIDRIDPLKALLDGGQHLLLEEGDFQPAAWRSSFRDQIGSALAGPWAKLGNLELLAETDRRLEPLSPYPSELRPD
jgi:hypothetical protein